MRVPRFLSPEAKAHWQTLAPRLNLDPLDRSCFALLCESWSVLQRFPELIEQYADHPDVVANLRETLEYSRRVYDALAKEFGFGDSPTLQ